MSEIFEYALIRVVPRIDRGESINVGVLLYSKSFRYLRARIELNEDRLKALDPGADVAAVRGALSAFGRACTEGPLAEQSLGERFAGDRAAVGDRPAGPRPRRDNQRPGRGPGPPVQHPGGRLAKPTASR